MALTETHWRSLFQERDFRRLWMVGFSIFVVRWLEMLAVGVFAYNATGSAFIVAMLTMLRLLPMGLFGAFLGAAAERMDLRRAQILILLMQIVASVVIALLALLGVIAVWHLAVAAFINGVGWAADNPVRRAMIGAVVGPARMGAAMSIDVGTSNASRMLGPTLGGVLLALLGLDGTFVLATLLYLPALIAAMQLPPAQRSAGRRPAPVLARIAEGLAAVRADKRLSGTLMITLIYNLFGWPFTSMIPVIGKDQLALGSEGVGILASMDGVGALLGAVLITLFVGPALYRRCYLGGVVLYMSMVIAFALIANPWMAGLALILVGIGGSGFGIMQPTLIYLATPVELRSRVLGLLSVCIGMGPIGFIGLGIAAELLGAPMATALMAACGLVALAVTHRTWKHISGG
ncbi:MAG: MFS transporter [Alphaproteobacteria bacterium]|nr:MFS transporter [Alphaproteobacteria bacterium]